MVSWSVLMLKIALIWSWSIPFYWQRTSTNNDRHIWRVWQDKDYRSPPVWENLSRSHVIWVCDVLHLACWFLHILTIFLLNSVHSCSFVWNTSSVLPMFILLLRKNRAQLKKKMIWPFDEEELVRTGAMWHGSVMS